MTADNLGTIFCEERKFHSPHDFKFLIQVYGWKLLIACNHPAKFCGDSHRDSHSHP